MLIPWRGAAGQDHAMRQRLPQVDDPTAAGSRAAAHPRDVATPERAGAAPLTDNPRLAAQRQQLRAGFGPAGGPVQRVRERIPLSPDTVLVVDDGFARLARLKQLIVEAEAVLEQIPQIRDYESIKPRAAVWYPVLSQALKAARNWVLANPPKNKHTPLPVPDDVFFDLVNPCLGYRRELNESYDKFKTTIEGEQAELAEKYKKQDEEVDDEDEWENPLSVPKWLYRWVSTDEAKRALKDGIAFHGEGGGIPTSTKPGVGIAITSGAVATDKCLAIDTSLIPGFKFEYVPTRSALKEVKIKCDVPAEAISKA